MDSVRRELIMAEEGERLCLLDKYWMCVLREKFIYEALNKFETTSKLMSGYFWANTIDKNKFKEIMDEMVASDTSFIGVEIKKVYTEDQPPTRFRTNHVIAPAQIIVDTYGVPRYQELNPAVFTVTTFPYLFGVMFGDMGHGGLLMIFAIWLVLGRRKYRQPGSFTFDAWPFRYMLLGMGFFAVYCGLIYNEFFGISTTMFSSCYRMIEKENRFLRVDPECVISVGIDPVWSKSSNEISFLNSFKMKLSIVIGVIHMILGIFLKGVNSIYFKDWPTFCFEFLPMLAFFLSTFGYMVVLIVVKWLVEWTDKSPPSIVNTMINFISKADPPFWGDGSTQLLLQRLLARSLS